MKLSPPALPAVNCDDGFGTGVNDPGYSYLRDPIAPEKEIDVVVQHAPNKKEQ